MNKRLFSVTALFCGIAILALLLLWNKETKKEETETYNEVILAVNELEQLAKEGRLVQMTEKSQTLQASLREKEPDARNNRGLVWMCIICISFFGAFSTYVYYAILRPFDKMKGFAEQVAGGNLNVPLDYERSNYFGAFTWAFDSMRREITKARACEKEAIENNKTVIATLSHDIKTPIASIRAYAEGLEANMDNTPEKRERYVGVIMRKCDEVSKLTNDLFLHSLADLEKLKIAEEPVELCSFVGETVEELAAEHEDVTFSAEMESAYASVDRNRLKQVIENLVNNARKYAKSPVEVRLCGGDEGVRLHFRDYGGGIPDEDIPFIFDKFYRGKNCGAEQGSGLGLYIVKYLVMQMRGTVQLRNLADGFEVILHFPMISQKG